MEDHKKEGPGFLPERLTRRELNILAHMANDRSSKEIAKLETLTYGSVKWYIHQIYAKLGVDNRSEAITQAREFGLLKPASPLSQVNATQSPPPRTKHNLPYQLTSFIGRKKELSKLHGLLKGETVRLVTLTGPGGTGKTRLALKAAEGLLEDFLDGIYLVELAPLSDPGLVVETIAAALGLRESMGRSIQEAVAGYLENKHLLLILDNCEHLVAECARLADWLLKSSPQLKLLVTSREILELSGEMSVRVPPLELPDTMRLPGLEVLAQVEAVRLFVERAQQAAPGFVLDEGNAAAVAQICQRLDGIPLALELAAARLRMMTVQQIAARLDNVFRLLTGGSRSVMPRQQTLKAVMDWSYAPLSNQEKLALQRLSVFAGSWTLEGAEAVCNGEGIEIYEVLDLLGGLVDKSLAQLSSTERSEGRYSMLETVRQYAHDKLLESREGEAVRDRHLAYYLQMSEAFAGEVRGRVQVMWLERIERDLDNLRLALEWSLAGHVEDGLRLASNLSEFWNLQSQRRSEGMSWLEKMLAAEAEMRGSQPMVVGVQSNSYLLAWVRAANAVLFHAIYTYETQCLLSPEQRKTMMEEGIALCRELGDTASQELALALIVKGHFLRESVGGEGITYLQESLSICQKKGYIFLQARCLIFLRVALSICFATNRQWHQERQYLEECLSLFRQIEDPDGIAACLENMAELARHQGDYAQAYTLTSEAQEYYRRINSQVALNIQYILQLYAAIELGEDPRDFQLAEEALEYFRGYGDTSLLTFSLILFCEVEWVRGNLNHGNDLGKEACTLSLKQHHPELVPYSHYSLGRIALTWGDLAEARRLLIIASSWMAENKDPIYITQLLSTQLLSVWVTLLAAEGKMEQAVKVCGALDDTYQRLAYQETRRGREEYAATKMAARQALGEEAFTRIWKEGQALTLWQALQLARQE